MSILQLKAATKVRPKPDLDAKPNQRMILYSIFHLLSFMKKLIGVLALALMIVPCVVGYDAAEFEAYSAGVMSVSAIGATLNVTDDIIILSRPAREDDYIYTDSPINHAGDLISAGEKI
jgi:hypothetical protein